jgi:hypothetical protein
MTDSTSDSLRSLIGAVQITGVRLGEMNAITRIRSADELSDPQLLLAYRAVPSARANDGLLELHASMEAKVVNGADQETADPPVAIRVVLQLRYQIPSNLKPADDVLAEFASTNGVFNAWPYWREFIQTTVARMELPPLVLPVFRLERRPETAETTMPRQNSSGRAKAQKKR